MKDNNVPVAPDLLATLCDLRRQFDRVKSAPAYEREPEQQRLDAMLNNAIQDTKRANG